MTVGRLMAVKRVRMLTLGATPVGAVILFEDDGVSCSIDFEKTSYLREATGVYRGHSPCFFLRGTL
jgi:hypothetical protein